MAKSFLGDIKPIIMIEENRLEINVKNFPVPMPKSNVPTSYEVNSFFQKKKARHMPTVCYH